LKTGASSKKSSIFCLIAALALTGCCLNLTAQVTVTGTVKDKENGRPLPYAFVINHRTQNGIFCDQQGRFSITTLVTDSLLFSLTGYEFTKVILADSLPKPAYRINVLLRLKSVQLKTFTVKAPKTFDQILVELEKAERMKVIPTTVASALESPITYLYMQFSKEGKAIRKIAELRSEDAKQELIRELFTRYMVAHIIDLNENDMDDFIRFSGLSYSLKTFDTEYDLVVFVKQQFVEYKKHRGIED
jgi:hypothetical protein